MHAVPANNAMDLLWSADPNDIDALFARAIDEQTNGAANANDMVFGDLDLPDPTTTDPLANSRQKLAKANAKAKANANAKTNANVNATANAKPTLTFVTGNAKKLEEVKAILAAQAASSVTDASGGGAGASELPYEVQNMKIDLPELQVQ